MTTEEIGKVIWFDKKKGFGFVNLIKPESELCGTDVFVHFSSIQCDSKFKVLYPGEVVSLTVEKDNSGEDKKQYSTSNVCGLYGSKLMIDNDKYIYKIIRRRDEDGDGGDGGDGE